MRKAKILVLVIAACMMNGCGAQPANAPAQEESSIPADGAESAGTQEAGQEVGQVPAEAESEEQKNATQSSDSYIFVYEGTQIGVNQEMAGVLEALGEPASYFEAASCAFEGLDKMYTYPSFEIDTYPEGEKDYISCIYFRDDMVQTQEGVCLYMTRADMEAAYGMDYKEDNGSFVYEKGNGKLSFILNENDEIVSIEYKTMVAYN